jgi:tetratricopeptide (TPR) repeat protein
MTALPKHKMVSVSLDRKRLESDPVLFPLLGEISDLDQIQERIRSQFNTEIGQIQVKVDSEKIYIEWQPTQLNREAERLHADAIDLAKTKRYEDAITRWHEAHRLNAEDADYTYKTGLAYFEIKDYKQSIDALEQTLRICPIHTKALLVLGINWIKLRRFDEAERRLSDCLRLEPMNPLGLLNLGAVLTIQKKFNEAEKLFQKVIQITPKEVRAFLGLARIHALMNDAETANMYYERVINQFPNTNYADIAKKSIIVKKDQLLAPTKDTRESYMARGISSYLSGDYREATEYYKQYLGSHPSDDLVWFSLGETHLRKNELVEAFECLKRAAQLKPNQANYYKSLGITLHYMERSEELVRVLKKAIELGKNDTVSYSFLGINQLKLKQTDDAIHNLKIALSKNSNNLLAQYHLYQIYKKEGDTDKAKMMMNSIQQIEYTTPLKSIMQNQSQNNFA